MLLCLLPEVSQTIRHLQIHTLNGQGCNFDLLSRFGESRGKGGNKGGIRMIWSLALALSLLLHGLAVSVFPPLVG